MKERAIVANRYVYRSVRLGARGRSLGRSDEAAAIEFRCGSRLSATLPSQGVLRSLHSQVTRKHDSESAGSLTQNRLKKFHLNPVPRQAS